MSKGKANQAVVEQAGPREMPGDFRCDVEPPRSTVISDAIALIEGEGGPEPSAVKKHLMAYRRVCWESHVAGGGPNLLQEIDRLERRIEGLGRETEPCRSCHRGADPAKLKALTDARRERARLAESLAARHGLLDQLRGEREKALGQLRESVSRALGALVDSLAIPAALQRDRTLYVSAPEAIPQEIVRLVGIAERAGELSRRVDPRSSVGPGQGFRKGDEDLADALRARLAMPSWKVTAAVA
jgi:hypothetical protein